ncbi:hypothetical protein GCM10022237_36290 [Nocardioides ginsengisoli]|uniref:Uncharacterized protein n=1 Tax=Nocardioides ginsengisoli TaxID=363868 RepID=A0ABW3W173_9ACTN
MGAAIAINDVVVHEGDLHEAIGLDRPPVVQATSLALAGYGFSLDHRVRKAGLPAVAFAYDGKRRVFGEGEPAAVVSADRPVLVRLLASQMTSDERRDPGDGVGGRPGAVPADPPGVRPVGPLTSCLGPLDNERSGLMSRV